MQKNIIRDESGLIKHFRLGKIDVFICLLLSTAVAVFNLRYFNSTYFPVHDTLSVYQFFAYFYSELIANNNIAWWLPYTALGIPSDSYIFFTFGPNQYLALIIGYLFEIKNVLILFSTSLLFDAIFLSIGMYLLAYSLSRDRLTSLLVGIISGIVIFYDRQVYWNFKLLLPIPFSLYFINVFFLQYQIRYLILSMLTMFMFAFGSVGYTLVVQVYYLTFYLILCCLLEFKLTRSSNETKSISINGVTLPLIVSAILTIGIAWFKISFGENLVYNALSRGQGFGVSYDSFISYGGNGELAKFGELITSSPYSNPHDFLIYSGVVVLAVFFAGIFMLNTNIQYIPLYISAIFILALTVPGLKLVSILYYLPGFDYVRHIAYFSPMIKIVVIAGASLSLSRINAISNNKFFLALAMILIAKLFLAILYFADNDFTKFTNIYIPITLIVLAACKILLKNRSQSLLLIVGVLAVVDCLYYRHVVDTNADLYLVAYPEEYKTVRRLEYVNRKDYSAEMQSFAMKPLDMYGIGTSYLNVDPCDNLRQDLVTPGIKQLFLNNNGGIDSNDPKKFLITGTNNQLRNAINCGGNKINIYKAKNYDSFQKGMKDSEKVGEVEYPSKFSSTNIEFKYLVDGKHASIIKYSDAFDPRWTVHVDGYPKDLLKIDGAFKGVYIEHGSHEVKFRYNRGPFEYMLLLIVISMFFSMILIIREAFKND